MRTRLIHLLTAIILASATGFGQMTPHYSSYDNVTMSYDSNGNLISATVTSTLTGYTSWNNYPPCHHTGTVVVDFGGVFSSATVGPVWPNYYMNKSTHVTLPGTAPCFIGTGCTISQDYAEVDCECMGEFYNADGANSGGTVTSCPTSVALSGSTTESLANIFPAYKTGVGIMSKMQAYPSNLNWNGSKLTEILTIVSTSCPSDWSGGPLNLCNQTSTFTVGNNGLTAEGVDGSHYPPFTNVFYDEHVATSAVSMLDASGINSCQFSCRQQYICGGAVRGTFTDTFSFTKGTMQGQAVTNVSVSKQ